MRPMLATRGTRLPTGDEWCHEVKWDGMRTLVDIEGGRVRVTSRNGNDVTASFPELAALAQLGLPDVLLDGELVAFHDGRPDFGVLAQRLHRRSGRGGRPGRGGRAGLGSGALPPVTLLLFDVLQVAGRDLTGHSLTVRRADLEALELGDDLVQVPPTYDDGEMLLEATRQQRLEGVVSKRRSSRYEPGVRSPHWLKFPHRDRTSWVVGGWRPETGSEHRMGALLVGEPTHEGLRYRGRVGSGLTGRTGRLLAQLVAERSRATSPFVDVPKVDAAGARWVEPDLVVDVESLGLSGNGRLRQPSFRGVRDDLTPADLVEGEQ